MKTKDDGFNANFLRVLRKEAGLTQTELADNVGVSLKSIQNWEAGAKSPTNKNRLKMEELFDIPSFTMLSDVGQIAYCNLAVAILRGDNNVQHNDFLLRAAEKLKALPKTHNDNNEQTGEVSDETKQTIISIIGTG